MARGLQVGPGRQEGPRAVTSQVGARHCSYSGSVPGTGDWGHEVEGVPVRTREDPRSRTPDVPPSSPYGSDLKPHVLLPWPQGWKNPEGLVGSRDREGTRISHRTRFRGSSDPVRAKAEVAEGEPVHQHPVYRDPVPGWAEQVVAPGGGDEEEGPVHLLQGARLRVEEQAGPELQGLRVYEPRVHSDQGPVVPPARVAVLVRHRVDLVGLDPHRPPGRVKEYCPALRRCGSWVSARSRGAEEDSRVGRGVQESG